MLLDFTMHKSAITASQVLLVLFFLCTLGVQAVILPVMASQSAEAYPEVGYLYLPFLVLAIATIACGQIVLACIWMLLRMVRRDRIFSKGAFVWVAIMIGALIMATVLAGVMFVILTVILRLGGPSPTACSRSCSGASP